MHTLFTNVYEDLRIAFDLLFPKIYTFLISKVCYNEEMKYVGTCGMYSAWNRCIFKLNLIFQIWFSNLSRRSRITNNCSVSVVSPRINVPAGYIIYKKISDLCCLGVWMEPGHPRIGPKRLKNIDRTSSLVNPACQTECAHPGTLPSVDRPTRKYDWFTPGQWLVPLLSHHLG